MDEFELIRKYFFTQPVLRADVVAGIGDDAALVEIPSKYQLVITSDLFQSGVHFFPDAEPGFVGHKALAVNLSDLAAMGAIPAWFTLGLSLPAADESWLRAFCQGMFSLARRYGMQLIGGDTTRGPLSVCISAHGFVPRGEALLRSGARPGDRIYVTGELGDAGLALRHRLGTLCLSETEVTMVNDRLVRPQPRVEQGQALRGTASSAIDISDGLIADLDHILNASEVAARVRIDAIPISETYRSRQDEVGWDLALSNGDDYELCFTVPGKNVSIMEELRSHFNCRLTQVGEIVSGRGLQVFDRNGNIYKPKMKGHNHFIKGD